MALTWRDTSLADTTAGTNRANLIAMGALDAANQSVQETVKDQQDLQLANWENQKKLNTQAAVAGLNKMGIDDIRNALQEGVAEAAHNQYGQQVDTDKVLAAAGRTLELDTTRLLQAAADEGTTPMSKLNELQQASLDAAPDKESREALKASTDAQIATALNDRNHFILNKTFEQFYGRDVNPSGKPRTKDAINFVKNRANELGYSEKQKAILVAAFKERELAEASLSPLEQRRYAAANSAYRAAVAKTNAAIDAQLQQVQFQRNQVEAKFASHPFDATAALKANYDLQELQNAANSKAIRGVFEQEGKILDGRAVSKIMQFLVERGVSPDEMQNSNVLKQIGRQVIINDATYLEQTNILNQQAIKLNKLKLKAGKGGVAKSNRIAAGKDGRLSTTTSYLRNAQKQVDAISNQMATIASNAESISATSLRNQQVETSEEKKKRIAAENAKRASASAEAQKQAQQNFNKYWGLNSKSSSQLDIAPRR